MRTLFQLYNPMICEQRMRDMKIYIIVKVIFGEFLTQESVYTRVESRYGVWAQIAICVAKYVNTY